MRRTKPPGRPKRKWTLRDKVLAVAKKERIPREKNPRFLNRDVPYRRDLEVPDQAQAVNGLLDDLLDGRGIYKRAQWVRDLNTLLANLIESYRLGRPVSISLDSKNWHQPARYEHPTYHTVELVHRMREESLIGMRKGTEGAGRVTRIWSLPALLRAHPEIGTNVVARPPAELVELRERRSDDKVKLLDYPETDETRRMRSVLTLEHFLICANLKGFPLALISDSRCRLVKEASLYVETSFE